MLARLGCWIGGHAWLAWRPRLLLGTACRDCRRCGHREYR